MSYEPVPHELHDRLSGTSYIRGNIFRKGGYATKHYLLTKKNTTDVFAGKIVAKKLLKYSHENENILHEIEIYNKPITHKHVVGFHSFFDDNNFIYVILENCKKLSMMELHMRRKALTDPEVRYFMRQLFDGVSYLHLNHIVHRNLELTAVFLNEKLEVKIGDFGLATTIESGHRKIDMSRTPTYVAPEILSNKRHSYEVDVWSLGCIMYTLIVGTRPFEALSRHEIFAKIMKCEYHLPELVPPSAANFLRHMLKPNPDERPKVESLSEMEYMKNGYCPKELPQSCLIMPPRFDTIQEKQPLSAVNRASEENGLLASVKKGARPSIVYGSSVATAGSTGIQYKNFILALNILLTDLFSIEIPAINSERDEYLEEISDPGSQPIVWISKWGDQTGEYGFCYLLVDDVAGIMFNDSTHLSLHPNEKNVHYIEKDGTETYHIMNQTPPQLEEKKELLQYYKRYMNECLNKTGESVPLQESDSLSRIPHLHMWRRSSSAIIMQLSNGTLQINFKDHSKIIMCPLMEAVSYIDVNMKFRTFKFSTIAEKGCTTDLRDCLEYAMKKTSSLLEK